MSHITSLLHLKSKTCLIHHTYSCKQRASVIGIEHTFKLVGVHIKSVTAQCVRPFILNTIITHLDAHKHKLGLT